MNFASQHRRSWFQHWHAENPLHAPSEKPAICKGCVGDSHATIEILQCLKGGYDHKLLTGCSFTLVTCRHSVFFGKPQVLCAANNGSRYCGVCTFHHHHHYFFFHRWCFQQHLTESGHLESFSHDIPLTLYMMELQTKVLSKLNMCIMHDFSFSLLLLGSGGGGEFFFKFSLICVLETCSQLCCPEVVCTCC